MFSEMILGHGLYSDDRLIGWAPAGLEGSDAKRIIQNPMVRFLSFSLCKAQAINTFVMANTSLDSVRVISTIGGLSLQPRNSQSTTPGPSSNNVLGLQ